MILLIAQGFGAGKMPFAPGTFGSLVGLIWFVLLIASGNLWGYIVGMMGGIAFSVWLCGAAEKILKQIDPGSIVLDEIVAMPVCFASWVGLFHSHHGHLPTPEYFVSLQIWPWTVGVFLAFRFFDVLKPWPVRQSQSLPGGWGVTVDDLLASVYVNVVSAVILRFAPLTV
ncbi:MAG TPA: phosphatidylglycerophosphatase A [Candidatus Eisenbacteria bacterium]|nr:phosphatidylglycerophosphatase A [Candidatus Eisenbacteria bacterium]